jgi:hypothetical protein
MNWLLGLLGNLQMSGREIYGQSLVRRHSGKDRTQIKAARKANVRRMRAGK